MKATFNPNHLGGPTEKYSSVGLKPLAGELGVCTAYSYQRSATDTKDVRAQLPPSCVVKQPYSDIVGTSDSLSSLGSQVRFPAISLRQ